MSTKVSLIEFYEKYWKIINEDGTFSDPPALSSAQKEILRVAENDGKIKFIYRRHKNNNQNSKSKIT